MVGVIDGGLQNLYGISVILIHSCQQTSSMMYRLDPPLEQVTVTLKALFIGLFYSLLEAMIANLVLLHFLPLIDMGAYIHIGN